MRDSTLTNLAARGSLTAASMRWLGVYGAALAAACGNGGQTGDEHSGNGGQAGNGQGNMLEGVQELKGTAPRLGPSGGLPNSASADGWEFGWKFYAEEATPQANIFFSPYSISVAAAMLVAGAAGETKTEMQQALSFSSDGEAFHQARNTVAQALATRNRPGSAETNAQVLRVSNDFWVEPTFRPAESFLDTLSTYYGASTFLAPFSSDPEAARLTINEKVATDTEQLITDLLPPMSIEPDVVFVLTNALYFKANWANEFLQNATADTPFQAQSGRAATVPMMYGEFRSIPHVATPDYEAIALPYFGPVLRRIEFIAIMPTEGTFDAFSDDLTADSIATISAELEARAIDLSFPKFEIKTKVPLKERLQALGMLQAFEEGAANFSGITPLAIYISDAFHDAAISIDEQGTEAAAATAFLARPISEPVSIPVVFDHPFVFFIRDIETNALLFVGHYANP